MSYDLLYGRAGFLWAALFLNRYLGQGTVPDHLLSPIVAAILAGGRVGAADHEACPLLYRFHNIASVLKENPVYTLSRNLSYFCGF